MQSILVRSRVGADGILHLDIPSGLADTDVEVTVILQPVNQPTAGRAEELGWSSGFFESVLGSWQGERLERECEGGTRVVTHDTAEFGRVSGLRIED
jgi:hypothetical protein